MYGLCEHLRAIFTFSKSHVYRYLQVIFRFPCTHNLIGLKIACNFINLTQLLSNWVGNSSWRKHIQNTYLKEKILIPWTDRNPRNYLPSSNAQRSKQTNTLNKNGNDITMLNFCYQTLFEKKSGNICATWIRNKINKGTRLKKLLVTCFVCAAWSWYRHQYRKVIRESKKRRRRRCGQCRLKMNSHFTQESRDALRVFSLFLTVKTISKLNMVHNVKIETEV